MEAISTKTGVSKTDFENYVKANDAVLKNVQNQGCKFLEPDPRVPIILGRPFLRTAKALIDLYEEKLTLRVGKDELVYYAEKSKKNKDKNFVHAISIIDFSKDDPFSGSTTTHSNDLSPSSSPVKTSDNFEKFADELAPLDSLPPGNDKSTLKKDLHEENFQDHSNPLLDEMKKNYESSKSNILKIQFYSTHLYPDKGLRCYFDSEGDVTFLDNLLSDDDSHNLVSEVITDHEPEQIGSSITFSPRSDPLTMSSPVNSVLSKQSLAHSQAHSHVINGEAHMECGFCAISTQRTSTMSHQRNDTLAILNCAHFDPTAQDQAQMIRRIKWLRLKDWRARQERLEASPTGYK
ncbi:hypothetical protein Tco_0087060 [Tanacetum coccineum]